MSVRHSGLLIVAVLVMRLTFLLLLSAFTADAVLFAASLIVLTECLMNYLYSLIMLMMLLYTCRPF